MIVRFLPDTQLQTVDLAPGSYVEIRDGPLQSSALLARLEYGEDLVTRHLISTSNYMNVYFYSEVASDEHEGFEFSFWEFMCI